MELRGITVTLYTTTQNGVDAFNNPIEVETAVTVDNVLVGEPSADEVVSATSLYGKKVVYVLAIPKSDTHDWHNKRVVINGVDYRTFGFPTEGIDSMIPLPWNKKVKVERYG